MIKTAAKPLKMIEQSEVKLTLEPEWIIDEDGALDLSGGRGYRRVESDLLIVVPMPPKTHPACSC